LGRRGLAFAPAEPGWLGWEPLGQKEEVEEGTQVGSLVEGSAVATDAEEEGTGAGLLGGGGGAAVWTTLGLALREERQRGERRRRALVRIPYGSPTRRCSPSSYSLWQGIRRSCPSVERERVKEEERVRRPCSSD
jgi:hypothetical protein